jgi:hypothetical protein
VVKEESAAYSGHSESNGIWVPSMSGVRAYAWYGCALTSAKRNTEGENADVEAKIGTDTEASLVALIGRLDDKQLARAEVLRRQLAERYGTPPP